MKKKKVWVLPAGVLLAAALSTAVFVSVRNAKTATAAETLNAYVEALNGGDYEAMYRLLDDDSRKEWKKDDFTERNQKIYEGIEASDVSVRIIQEGSRNRTSGQTTQNLTYEMKMNTAAGELSFTQTATFHKKTGEDYLLSWNDSLIFPDLGKTNY